MEQSQPLANTQQPVVHSSGSTPYVHVNGNNTYSDGMNAIAKHGLSAATGYVAASNPYVGLFLGSAQLGYNILSNIRQNRANKKAQKEQNAFNANEANKSFERQNALMAKEAKMNSIQSQVSNLKQAGLNPALATGQVSASPVSPVSASSASGSPLPAGSPLPVDFGAVAMSAAEVENLRTSSDLNRANTEQIALNSKYIDSMRQADIAKQLEEITKLKTSAALDESQKKQIDELIDLLKQQYESTIALNNANASAIPQSIEESKSRQSLNEQHVKESKQNVVASQQNVKESKARETLANEQALTEFEKRVNLASETGLNEAKALTEAEQQKVLSSVAALNEVNKDVVQQEFDLSSSQRKMIEDYCREHDLDSGFVNGIMIAFNNFCSEIGKDVPKTALDVLKSWLDAGNWLHFFASSKFNEVIARNAESNINTSEQVQVAPSAEKNDVAKTVPSDENFNKHAQQMRKELNNPEFDKEYISGMRFIIDKLNQHQITRSDFNDFKKDLYYSTSPKEFQEKFYYNYYKFKHQLSD